MTTPHKPRVRAKSWIGIAVAAPGHTLIAGQEMASPPLPTEMDAWGWAVTTALVNAEMGKVVGKIYVEPSQDKPTRVKAQQKGRAA